MRRPLLLTGGPAVGKSTTGRTLAGRRDRAAFIDVDDVRQLVVSGGAAPWDGAQGAHQQRLGALNACALATSFRAEGFDVVLADVVTPATIGLYRASLADCLVVRLHAGLAEARRRASTRRTWLTDAEFLELHESDERQPPAADVTLQVAGLSLAAQCELVASVWESGQR